MKNIYISIIILSCTFLGVAAQDDDLKVYNYWSYYDNVSNDLYKHLYSIAVEQINKRASYMSALETNDSRRQYPEVAKKKIQKVMGAFPEKTPLNPVITGKIKKEDFTVEKLYFESRSGYYVTAALFLPTKRKGKTPAILYCCGHSKEGFRSEAYQRSILNLVKKGFIVLAFDPVGQGERLQYFDEKGKSFFGATHEHSYPGSQSFVTGLSPANYFVWDGIRAIDYLISRKEVDPQRIGITGRSGGGTQTAYIAAMDHRIAAAAPECYITSFDMLLRSKGPQDAEQVLMYSLKEGLDISDLIEARAPNPTLMITTTSDIFSIQGARDVYKEAKTIYDAYGKFENLMMVEDDAGHISTTKNREALHAFFQHHLNNPGDPEDLDIELFDEQDLWVTPDGQIQKFKSSETLFSLNEKYTQTVLAGLQNEKGQYDSYLKNIRSKVIEMTGYKKPDIEKKHIFSGRLWRNTYSVEKYLIQGPGVNYVPVLRLLPKDIQPKDVILFLDDKGKSFAVNEGLAGQLVQKGYEVIVPDLSGIGELSGGYKGGDAYIQGTPLNVWYAGVLTHKTPLAIRMEEIECIIDFINEVNDSPAKIIGLACGTLTSDLLHSALFEDRFAKLAFVNPLYSYLSIVQEREYRTKFIMSAIPGVIASYDLPDLVSAIMPKKVLMINPVNAVDKEVDKNSFYKSYEIVGKYFEETGEASSFTVKMSEKSILSTLVSWDR